MFSLRSWRMKNWIRANLAGAREQSAARPSGDFLSVPAVIGGRTVPVPGPADFATLFQRAPAVAAITGPAGSGKTVLSRRIAEWALAGAFGETVLPLFFDHLKKTSTEKKAVSLALELLSKGPALLIVESADEPPGFIKDLVRVGLSADGPGKLLIVSRSGSAVREHGAAVVEVKTLTGAALHFFVEQRIAAGKHAGLISSGELFAELARIARAREADGLTAFEAVMVADLIAARAAGIAETGAAMRTPAIVSSWLGLTRTKEEVDALTASATAVVLEKHRAVFTNQRNPIEPPALAEYLAAAKVAADNGNDPAKWKDFLGRARAKPGAPESTRSFLLAVREAALGESGEHRANAAREIAEFCGLDLAALGKKGRAEKAQAIAEELASAGPDHALMLIGDLAGLGEEALIAMPFLVRALSGNDRCLRLAAAQTLAEVPPVVEALPALASALSDRDQRVAAAAVLALARAREKGVDFLAGGLKADRPMIRELSAEALGRLGEAAAGKVMALSVSLDDEHPRVRRAAAQALERLGKIAAAAAPALILRLDDRERMVREAAARALGSIGEAAASAAPRLSRVLAESDAWEKDAAADALAGIGQGAVKDLCRLLDHDDAGVRRRAAATLAAIGGPSVGDLIETLKRTTPRAMFWASQALAGIGPKAAPAVDALKEAAGSSDAEVRRAAALALGRIGAEAKSAIPDLIAALSGDDPLAAKNAAEALAGIGFPSVAPLIDAGLAAKEADTRARIAQALGDIGEAAAPELMRCLKDEQCRDLAAEALVAMGAAASSHLARSLSDFDPGVRFRAARALSLIGPNEQCLPALSEAVRDHDIGVRAAARAALSRMGEKGKAVLSAAGEDRD